MDVYLDHAAATPMLPEVKTTMLDFFDTEFGNPGSLHQKGKDAKAAVEQARTTIAQVIHATPQELIFVGSGTESCNLAIIGSSMKAPEKRHLVISATEHHAVLEPAKLLASWGYELTILPVDEKGQVHPQQVADAVREDTFLVSVIWGNNEIGTLNPIKEITRAVKQKNPETLVHTDACQVLGQLPIDVRSLNVDLLTFSAAKIGGPKGIGALYYKQGVELHPMIIGGGQEQGLHAGTENVPAIAGFAKAMELINTDSEAMSAMRDAFIAQIQQAIPQAILNGHATDRLPNNVSITIPGIEGEAAVIYLDKAGIAASTGSACTTSHKGPSHVIKALGYSDEEAKGTIRFTLGKDTTKEELGSVVQELTRIVTLLS